MTSHIPIVDFSAFSISKEQRPDVNTKEVQHLAKEIYSAFSTVGFVYLKKHGISLEEINGVLTKTDAFFGLSKEIKSKYQKSKGDSHFGWDELERESTNINRPPDLKESFDLGSLGSKDVIWPADEFVPDFKSIVSSFFKRCIQLGKRVLCAIAIGMNLDPDVFVPFYKGVGTSENESQLRFNYYPKIADNIEVKSNQIRCGEHTDYGAITLLIQDDAGGLEVGTLDGEFVPATPIPGTILVNIGDLMQRWTSDKLKSTPHRVCVPEDEIKKAKHRRSIAFFFDPDGKTVISPLDGLEKYPPVEAGPYITDLLRKTYKF